MSLNTHINIVDINKYGENFFFKRGGKFLSLSIS